MYEKLCRVDPAQTMGIFDPRGRTSFKHFVLCCLLVGLPHSTVETYYNDNFLSFFVIFLRVMVIFLYFCCTRYIGHHFPKACLFKRPYVIDS